MQQLINAPSRDSQNLLEELQFLLSECCSAFETPFFLWKHESQWESIGGAGSHEHSNFSALQNQNILSLLKKTGTQKEPWVHTLDSQEIVVIPCKEFVSNLSKETDIVAVGFVSGQDCKLIQRQAGLLFRLLRQKKHYETQISRHLEELNWLRDLAQQMEFCDAGDQLSDLAQKVLPYEAEVNAISEDVFGTFEVSLTSATGTLFANYAKNIDLHEEQEELVISVVRSLINLIDAKDSYTYSHSHRVALLAKRVARQLRMSEQECEHLYMAGLLHDVGKIGIPDEVLCKKEKLTDAEYEIIKQHPETGHSILKHLKPLQHVLPGVLHHHESYDGTGYPMQLKGEDIPLDGRILAVVDAYDTMTSSRPYRPAMSFEKAESILIENSGTQWDPKVVKSLFAARKDIHEICKRTEEEAKCLFDSYYRLRGCFRGNLKYRFSRLHCVEKEKKSEEAF